MPVPKGYTLDAAPPNLPPGYTLDQPQQGQPEDTRNWFQKSVDALSNVTPEQRKGHSALTNAAQDFGARVIGDIAGPIAHPLKTIEALPQAMIGPGGTGLIGSMVQGTVNDFKENGAAVAIPHLAADIGTGYATGEAIKAAPAVADAVKGATGKAASAVGGAAQDAGVGLMNKTVGTLKSDFKRGANPSRGYLETGNGPSLSMHSVAAKSADALEETGNKLGTAYKQATASGAKIPVEVVAQKMAEPIQKAIDLETRPGGTGNLAPIQNYIQQFGPAFEKAAQNGGFTPSELFEMKRGIAQNTNWSDPTQFSLKSVRQQQAGALSGILTDVVPETKALNQTYQDLTKMTARAEERANTGSRPLTSHIYKAGMTAVGALAGGMEGNALAGAAAGALLDSVPAKTTIASGLFRGGKALASFGDRLAPAEGAAVEGVPPNDLGGNGANNKPGNPQLTPPGSNPTTATQKWAELGAQKVLAHLESGSPSEVSAADVMEAAKSPKGKQLLIQASSLNTGSPMMEKVVQQIPKIEDSAPAAPQPAPSSAAPLRSRVKGRLKPAAVPAAPEVPAKPVETIQYSPEVTRTEGVEAKPIPAGAQQLTADIKREGTPKNFEGEYLKAALEPARAAWKQHLENVPEVGFTKPITQSGRKSLSAQLMTEEYPRPQLKIEGGRNGGEYSVVFEDYHTPEGSQQPIKVRQVIGDGMSLEAAKSLAEARLRSGQMTNPGEPFYNNMRPVQNVKIENTGTQPEGFNAPKLIVQVPGDGRFTIPNNLSAIEGAIKKADNFVPPKADVYKLPRVPKAPESFDQARHIQNLKRQIEESETDLRRAKSNSSSAMQVPYYQQQLDAAQSELREILANK
jgi:hypothetical protein